MIKNIYQKKREQFYKVNLKYIKRYKHIYLSEGLYVLVIKIINFILRKFRINFFLNTPLQKYQNFLTNKIIKISKKKVMHGIYKDTYFNNISHWNFDDFASKLIGCYEIQVQNKIIEIRNKYNLKNIINIGAGEGYHIIGCVNNNYFKKGFAYEINKLGQIIIKKNIVSNNLQDKIYVFGEGNFVSIKNNINNEELKKSLYLIDIEGGEYTFFNKANIKFFKESFFIIELHIDLICQDFKDKIKLNNNFFKIIKKYFTLEIIDNSARNPFQYKILDKFSDDEKFLMMSEHRPRSMQWLCLIPKNIL